MIGASFYIKIFLLELFKSFFFFFLLFFLFILRMEHNGNLMT